LNSSSAGALGILAETHPIAAHKASFTLRDLDMKDTTILKGLAIIAITLHNFFHVLGPAHQNEFTFRSTRFPIFLHTVVQPSHTIQAFFAFFGHFGVQVFIFLSAFGLAKRHWDDQSSWPAFMWGRIKKLYPVIGLVVLPWLIIWFFGAGPERFVKEAGIETLLMLLGVSTILGFELPNVGPWWFIPFIMQFYALWLPLRALTKKSGWVGLTVLALFCLGLIYFLNPLLFRWHINLLATPIGRMKGLCLGIAAARYPIRMPFYLALLALIVLILGSMYYWLWPLTFMAALIVSLWAYVVLRDYWRRVPLLERLGRYSMLIFLLNGVVRLAFLPFAISPGTQLLYGAISAVVSFVCAAFIHEVFVVRLGVAGPTRISPRAQSANPAVLTNSNSAALKASAASGTEAG
jgi:peptidoglycan/LPS O-acetylase OafA/YrhL